MTGPRPDRPVTIPQIACLVDGGCYVAPAGSSAAEELAVLPALRKAHDPAAMPVSEADLAGLLHSAAEFAIEVGWVCREDGHWVCPQHSTTQRGVEPKRFTVRECLQRHRARNGE